ncbi:sugar phosphate isomerase involved in capsule formation [Candidatus Scalindua japonica]|uniref:Sugar phosphate isomerase involved in capsule formation n=1 Tax=Candidatus Scalindua japonica TaxID=1284222 RepID=A0A286TXM0_9BACT|nr:KpsF/GutQ family sugar-phosphate isomerase [Candidatus Scalindua japonica]GAX60645.1 sugar phosphate isomerase involved in capsule formation [Candidatus Scalindua japonica]
MNIDIENEIIKVIGIEIDGLSQLKACINASVTEAVETIFNCNGKIILTGMGKSGLVAKKIASTMSSVGTPAMFMHPAEGMHGDLGIISAEDVVIAIGKSGESFELNGVLPSIKDAGAKIIGIMGNATSTLASYSNIVINIGDIEEACPFNMAPTTSSTVTMVLGDAMAVALMKMREFGLSDYARLHPGGQIGKRLTMMVSDVMLKGSNNPIINVSDSVKNCLSEISGKQAGAVSVVDSNGKMVGLVTDYDIRKHIEKEENIFSMEIKDIMNPDPIFVYEDEKAFAALNIMQEREKPITILSVLNRKNIVVGMLRMHDLVKEGL